MSLTYVWLSSTTTKSAFCALHGLCEVSTKLTSRWYWIIGFKWSDFVRTEDVRHATQQSPLSSIVKTLRLSLFGHIARMNESTDASRILFKPPSEVWRKPRGRPRNSWVRTVTNDLANSYTGLPEAREAAQDRVDWGMFTKHSATHSLWCMLILDWIGTLQNHRNFRFI